MSESHQPLEASKPARRRTKARIVEVREAGDEHRVVTTFGGTDAYRRTPCGGCPWRQDTTGTFPAEAFRHSARTAEDMSEVSFACHEAGSSKPITCAGFLLRGASHNLSVRLGFITGRYQDDVSDAGLALHPSYRAMAEANGVPPEDPALARCRE